jgi:PAS domain S-box-containing protein
MLARGRDARKEVEEQAAFEEAERARAERRAAAVLESLVDSSPVGIELFAPDGMPLRSNKAAERLLGKVPPPGISLFDPRGLKRAGLLEPQLRRVLAGTRVETPPTWYDPTEIGLPGVPGRKVCFRATVSPVFDNEGKVVRIAAVYEDLTEAKKLEAELREPPGRPAAVAPQVDATPVSSDVRDVEFRRRQLENALRESEDRYRSFVESVKGHVIARFSEDGHIVAISRAVEELWGIRQETILLDNAAYFSRIHPDDIEQVKTTEALARKTGTYPDGYEFRVVHMTTNAVRWLEARGAASGPPGRRTFDLIITDITGRKRCETMLLDREKKLGVILDSAADGVIVMDRDWIVLNWSRGAEKETRFAPGEAVGKRLWEIYPDLEKSGFGPVFRKAMVERTVQSYEGFYQDGREKYAGWFAVNVHPYDSGALAFIRSVSAQKRAELAWREADAKLKAMLEQPGIAITMKDHSLRYVSANPAALKMMGAAAGSSVAGKTDPELFNSKVSALMASHDRQVIARGQPVDMELALPDGSAPNATWYHVSKNPWFGPGGTVAGILDIAYDITSRVRTQQELLRRREYVEKMLVEQSQALRRAQDELARWTK